MFTKNFDYAYYPEEWEFTCDASDLSSLDEFAVQDKPRGTIVEMATLIRGPKKYAAKVPITFDEDGELDEEEIKWFDTREEAEAALAKTA